jgi:membrane-bound metal-dependent hydrolase YbcI (DUF457 family)
MPDVLTHFLVGVALALLIRKDGPRSEQMLIVLGAVIIDIERPITWLLESTPFYWIGLTSAFHSILGAVILSYVGAACFDLGTPFSGRFMLILYGCASHLLLDMMMYPWGELGVPLLYPLKLSFSFNLFWPDFCYFPLIGLALLATVFCIRILSAAMHR